MFDTCVSCLHCKRLPQNVIKYANVTHAAFAQNTSADVRQEENYISQNRTVAGRPAQ